VLPKSASKINHCLRLGMLQETLKHSCYHINGTYVSCILSYTNDGECK
jgi:hypothetical protein